MSKRNQVGPREEVHKISLDRFMHMEKHRKKNNTGGRSE